MSKPITILALLALLSGCSALKEVNQAILAIADTLPDTENTCITGPQGVQCYQYTVPHRGLTAEEDAAIELRVIREMLDRGEASPATVAQMAQSGELSPAVITGLVKSGHLPPRTGIHESPAYGGDNSKVPTHL